MSVSEEYAEAVREIYRLKAINADLLKAISDGSQATPAAPEGCCTDSFQIGYGAAFVF